MIPPRPPARILIIDDEHDLAMLLAEYLKSRGYQTDTAFSGEEGLDRLRQARYHLVLSDIRMPKLSGMDVLQAAKRLDPSVEVILITAYGDVPTAVEALKTGAYDFIEKPFSLEKVVRVIQSALERRELKTVKGLEETARAVFSTVQLERLLPLLTDLALTIAPGEDAFLTLSRDGKMEVAASSAVSEGRSLDVRLQAAQAVARLAEPARALAVSPPSDPRFAGIPGIAEVRFLLGYPMATADRFLGVLALCRTRGEDPFSASEIHNFSLFAALVTQAVHTASLYHELELKMQEVRRAEERAIQSEKMAALGRIVGGLAHELRNPLTGILCNIQLLTSKLTEPRSLEIAADIEGCGNRCNEVIENLLSYSRAARKDRAACEPRKLLESALELVSKHVGLKRIRVARDVRPVSKVEVNQVQIEQVLQNIVMNALQAMPEGGALTFRLRETVATPETMRRWAAPGAAALLRDIESLYEKEGEGWVVAEITDTGVGIPPQDMPLIFEPFFTTKEPGQGTGLGLYLSYEIVNANGGVLWASSPGRGKGTSFFVALPAAQGSAPRSRARRALVQETRP